MTSGTITQLDYYDLDHSSNVINSLQHFTDKTETENNNRSLPLMTSSPTVVDIFEYRSKKQKKTESYTYETCISSDKNSDTIIECEVNEYSNNIYFVESTSRLLTFWRDYKMAPWPIKFYLGVFGPLSVLLLCVTFWQIFIGHFLWHPLYTFVGSLCFGSLFITAKIALDEWKLKNVQN